ncbi:MAG: hypothetical protein ACMXYM_02790 [Candidatus Woesearchaeota archaeon]
MIPLSRARIRALSEEHPTKRDIVRFYTEISAAQRRSKLFESMFSVLIVAMLSFAVGRFFLLPWYVMLPFPSLYLLVVIVRIQRMDTIRNAERVFPLFRERLVTIKDNFSKTHEMEIGLEKDVLASSHEVEASGFFDPRRFSMKIILLLSLFFISGFFTTFTYEHLEPLWPDFSDDEEGGEGYDPNFWFWQRTSITGMDESGDMDSIDLIYGDEAELLEGLESMPIELKAAKDALGLTPSDGPRSPSERFEPTRIDAVGAEYYEDSIPLSKHAVVRNYFRDQS